MAASTLREGNVGAHGERQSTLLHTTDYLQPASRASPADHPLTAQPSLSLVILNYDLPPFTPSLWRQGVCLSLSYVQSMGKNALLNPCPIPCARDPIKENQHLSTLPLTCRVCLRAPVPIIPCAGTCHGRRNGPAGGIKICADGGANRLFDELPAMFPDVDPDEVRRRRVLVPVHCARFTECQICALQWLFSHSLYWS